MLIQLKSEIADMIPPKSKTKNSIQVIPGKITAGCVLAFLMVFFGGLGFGGLGFGGADFGSPLLADDLNQEVKTKTVEFTIRFNGKGTDIELKDIEWKDGMTVLSLMTQLQKEKKLSFKHRGKGITAFLTEIGGVKNSGSGGDNWIFRVNSKLGKTSFGVVKLSAGDKINWTFGKYRPNGK